MPKQTHLSYEERIAIKQGLDNGLSFKRIAFNLNRDPTTISKEVRNHRIFRKTGAYGRVFNNCTYKTDCSHKHLCPSCKQNRLCALCSKCTSICPDFKRKPCILLESAPYVCNGCKNLHACTLEKSFYNAKTAQEEYESLCSESRQGLSLSEKEIQQIDSLVSPLIMKGQSLHHIIHNNRDSISVSKSTMYRLIEYNVFQARNIDMPRKVRYAKRRVKKHVRIDKKCRVGRTYLDFRNYMDNHPDVSVVEIDSVEGTKGGKVLLTIHFVKAEFMLAFIREANTSQSVIDIFNELYRILGHTLFVQLFPVLLGDNGTEFSNPTAIETTTDGEIRTRLFYCDPSSPHQKGAAERNHEQIRRIIPKGKPLDIYTQEDISLMMNHVNSYGRPCLGNKTPYEIMSFMYGEEVLERLGCCKVAPNDVTLRPALLKKEGHDVD